MGIVQPSNLKVDYNYETKRWMVETNIALNTQQLERVLHNAKSQLTFRVMGEIGEKKRRMQEAIQNMSILNTDQYLVGDGDRILYTEPNKGKVKTMIIR